MAASNQQSSTSSKWNGRVDSYSSLYNSPSLVLIVDETCNATEQFCKFEYDIGVDFENPIDASNVYVGLEEILTQAASGGQHVRGTSSKTSTTILIFLLIKKNKNLKNIV